MLGRTLTGPEVNIWVAANPYADPPDSQSPLEHRRSQRNPPSPGPLGEEKPEREVKTDMASGNWTVYVPDSRNAITLPASLTTEEVRQTLVGTGYTSVETAEMTISGNTITFRRPQGGTKGA